MPWLKGNNFNDANVVSPNQTYYLCNFFPPTLSGGICDHSAFFILTGRMRGNETKNKGEKRTTINTKMIYKYILWCLFSNPFKRTYARTRTYIKKAGWMFINILYARHGNVAAEECNCSVGNIPRRSLAHIKRENLRHVCDNIPNKSQRGPPTP